MTIIDGVGNNYTASATTTGDNRYPALLTINGGNAATIGGTGYQIYDTPNGCLTWGYMLEGNPIAAPTITSFTPSSGCIGTTVTITGTNFTSTTAVQFNGIAAASTNVVSATSIIATVANGTTTGPISVTTLGGTATSASNFIINPGTGLLGTYYTGSNFDSFAFQRIDPQVNFDWDGGSPGVLLGGDSFSITWTGQLLAPQTGIYSLNLMADGPVSVWVNGQLLDDWLSPPWGNGYYINMAATQSYDIELDYSHTEGDSYAYLYWSCVQFQNPQIIPVIPQQLIPQGQLYAPPLTAVNVVATPASPQAADAAIVLAVQGLGGNTPVCQFLANGNVIQDYSTSTTCLWTPGDRRRVRADSQCSGSQRCQSGAGL